MAVQVMVDRPADRLIASRVEVLGGWVACGTADFSLRITCGGRELLVSPCPHPEQRWRREVRGFWTLLVVQELLGEVESDSLRVDLHWRGARLTTIRLRLLPMARELAVNYPLNLAEYPVPVSAHPLRVGVQPHTVVFPGLGAVGGSSLQQLLRFKMLRERWPVPVYSEPDAPEIWAHICAHDPPPFRWIDGHGCFAAAAGLGRPFARVTLLREPLGRLLSALDYGSLVHPEQLPFSCLETLLESGAAREHCQAFGLLRVAGVAVKADLPDPDLYALAKDRLDREYALVGITELFEESIFMLCELAGYSSIGMWWRVLSAPRSTCLRDLPGRTRSRLERLLAVDVRLYEESRRNLLERLDRCGYGQQLQHYKDDAAAQREIPDAYKAFECLRWRQTLAESELRVLRAATRT